MNKECSEWFFNQWHEFKSLRGREPDLCEWFSLVNTMSRGQDSPLRFFRQGGLDMLSRQSFVDLEIQGVAEGEIDWKVRDARANLNNRRYVSGTF